MLWKFTEIHKKYVFEIKLELSYPSAANYWNFVTASLTKGLMPPNIVTSGVKAKGKAFLIIETSKLNEWWVCGERVAKPHSLSVAIKFCKNDVRKKVPLQQHHARILLRTNWRWNVGRFGRRRLTLTFPSPFSVVHQIYYSRPLF